MKWLLLLVPGIYGGLHALPASSFWFSVQYVTVMSGSEQPLKVDVLREVKRPFSGEYAVIVRQDGHPVCDAAGGAFTYKVEPKSVLHVDMTWWAPSDPRCSNLPTGVPLVMETCWSVNDPLGGWLPPKRICIKSNEFTVTE